MVTQELLVEQLVVKAYLKMEEESRDMIGYDDVGGAPLRAALGTY